MVSMMRAAVAAWVLGAGLPSCATRKKEKSGAELRKKGYETLLKTVKPGMYRRQLYAVLPPCEKPVARPPSIWGVAGLIDYWAHNERHHLDPECYLTVFYQLKDSDEYRRASSSGRRTAPPIIRKPTAAIDPDSIDALLTMETPMPTEFSKGETPSKENPDDIIMSVSGVHLNSQPSRQIHMEFTTTPTQRSGFVFGRETYVGPLLPPAIKPKGIR